MGITFAILNRFGNMLWLKDKFISCKDFENSFFDNFKILVEIQFGTLALFVFIELISYSVTSGMVQERKIVLLFLWPR